MSTQQPASIPVYVMHERVRSEDADTFYGVYASLEAAQAKAAEDDQANDMTWRAHPPSTAVWLGVPPPAEFTATTWTAVTDFSTWDISRQELVLDGSDESDATLLDAAREVIKRRFGMLTAGDLIRALRKAAETIDVEAEASERSSEPSH